MAAPESPGFHDRAFAAVYHCNAYSDHPGIVEREQMIRLLLFSLSLAGLAAIAARWGGNALIHPQQWIILFFLFVLSAIVHQAMRRVTARRPDNWVGPY